VYDLDQIFGTGSTHLIIPIGVGIELYITIWEWDEWKYQTEKELGIKFS